MVPEHFRNDSVYSFVSPADDCKLRVSIEDWGVDASLEDHIRQKTQTVSETAIGASVQETGDMSVGNLPGKYAIVAMMRGDETPLLGAIALTKLDKHRILVFDLETPPERWEGRMREVFRGVCASVRIGF